MLTKKDGAGRTASRDTIIIAVALLYSGFLHYWLGMEAFWDTANYHYFIGWAASVANPYGYGALARENTFLNPLADLFNYLAFNASPYLGAVYHSLFLALAIYLAYKISRKVFE